MTTEVEGLQGPTGKSSIAHKSCYPISTHGFFSMLADRNICLGRKTVSPSRGSHRTLNMIGEFGGSGYPLGLSHQSKIIAREGSWVVGSERGLRSSMKPSLMGPACLL